MPEKKFLGEMRFKKTSAPAVADKHPEASFIRG